MNNSRKTFLQLLSAGLYGLNDNSKIQISNVNWNVLIKIATDQSVMAIAFDGLQYVPNNEYPIVDSLMDWVGQVSYIEVENTTHNGDLAALIR